MPRTFETASTFWIQNENLYSPPFEDESVNESGWEEDTPTALGAKRP